MRLHLPRLSVFPLIINTEGLIPSGVDNRCLVLSFHFALYLLYGPHCLCIVTKQKPLNGREKEMSWATENTRVLTTWDGRGIREYSVITWDGTGNGSIKVMGWIVCLLESIKSTKSYFSYSAKMSLIWDTGLIDKLTAVWLKYLCVWYLSTMDSDFAKMEIINHLLVLMLSQKTKIPFHNMNLTPLNTELLLEVKLLCLYLWSLLHELNK